MASLRDTVKEYQDELRDGIAWVVFWRDGRSWNNAYVYLDPASDTIDPDDLGNLEYIRDTDPRAIAVNGYYCGHLGADMNLEELTNGVRWHYDNHFNTLAEFIEARAAVMPPELIEAAREAAHAAGLPFSESPYRGREPDPYVYDGSMTPEDYELMHKMIAQERSNHMKDPLNICISNREQYENGTPGGEWLKLPTTAEQFQTALQAVGATRENFIISEHETPIKGITLDMVRNADIDELNYMAVRLETLDRFQTQKLNAAADSPMYFEHVGQFIDYPDNTDFFVLIPDVFNHVQLGGYYLEKSEMIQMPEEWTGAIDIEMLGQLAAKSENGYFTEHGYILESGDKWEPIFEGRDVPEEYRVTPQRGQEPEQPDPSKADYDAIAARQPAVAAAAPPEQVQPQPVIPLVLTAEKPAEKIKEITDKLEQGITDIFESEKYQSYLKTMSKFYNYSINNTILISMQKPDASLIAGYGAWQKNFERQVKKGEKGIKIIAPSPFKVKKEMEKIDPGTQKPITDRDGKPVTEEVEVKIPAYKVVSVFDVSQTEGKELPTIGVDELTGSVGQYKDFFAALEKVSPVPVAFENIETGANGYYHLEDKRIAIREGMSELQTLKTAIHEIAHARLHDVDLNAPKDEQNRVDKHTREVEAESIAYTVCGHYGLDTSDYSFGYVAGWSSGKELTELKASLETIRGTAAGLITEIDGHFAELQKDKEQTAEQQPGHEEWSEPAAAENAPDSPGVPSDEVSAYLPEQGEQDTGKAQAPDEPTTTVKYYPINEGAARRAKEAISFSDYRTGSATAEYRQYVDEAVKIAERQKARVDPMYHDKIDGLLDTYARKLAANMNNGYSITARVPSVLIAGPSNFPVRKKEKQNAASDRNMQEWRDIQGLLDKIRSTGMGGISADDPNAVSKLETKLAGLEKSQENMKAANAYYRKHKTLDGCPVLSAEQIQKLTAGMANRWYGRAATQPFEAYSLQNNNAEINRLKKRIEGLKKHEVLNHAGWKFDGGKVEANKEDNRLQVFFDEKPDAATREELKRNGFRWSPKATPEAGAWQRQLNYNAYYAANDVKSIQPITGERPTDLYRQAIKETAQPEQPAPEQQPVTAGQDDTYSIYQLKEGDGTRDLRFEPFDRLQRLGLAIDPVNYELVYTAPITADTDTLEGIYEKFNYYHPEDFTGHSLSVSDVVTLNHDGNETAHYVDRFGFKDVPEFLQSGQEQTDPDISSVMTVSACRSNYAGMTAFVGADDKIYIGKSENYRCNYEKPSFYDNSDNSLVFVSDNPKMYGFLCGDGWVKSQADMLKEGIFTGADYQEFARVQSEVLKAYPYKDNFTEIKFDGKPFDPSPVNYLETAEKSTEQNCNMIDGIINNTPTVAELEAMAKAGEPVNLTDLAAAIKAEKTAPARDTGKKPSIREQLKADKERIAAAPKKTAAKLKNADLEV